MRTKLRKFVSNDPFRDLPATTTILGGIVGAAQPSTYSLSPGLWNRFFDVLGLKGRYVAFDLARQDDLKEFLHAAFEFPSFLALTVTKPCKGPTFKLLESLPYEKEISARSAALGSLNYLIRNSSNRTLWVDRTDGPGFVRSLKKHAALAGKKVLVIGSGGTALSICFELIAEAAELELVDIVPESAQRMGAVLSPFKKRAQKLAVHSNWDKLFEIAMSSDIIINAMMGVTPFETEVITGLPENCLLADVHYTKDNAVFAQAVRAAGRTCIDGLHMRYGQFRFAAEKCGALLGFSPETLEKHLDAIETWFITENAHTKKAA